MKQHFLILAFLTTTFSAFSQSSFLEKSGFGILLGTKINQARYSVIEDINAFSIREVTDQRGYGFDMGVVAMYNFTEQLSIRPQSILSFGGSTLNYEYTNNESVEKKYSFNVTSVPCSFSLYFSY